jgi:hypothetical protein
MLDAAKSTSRVTRLQTEKGKKNVVAMFALTSIGFSALTLILQIVVVSNVMSIARKPAPSLVQLSDGQAIKVQAVGSQERSTEVVQQFVTDSLIMLMSWTNELPAASGEQKVADPGSLVKTKQGDKRITSSAFQASFTFGEGLREELVKILADMTPVEVFKGNTKTTLKFQHVTLPTLVDKDQMGKWKINVVATLIQYQQGRGDTIKIPFNKEIIVQAIDTPDLPKGGKFSNELESLIHTIRQAGLEIVSMKDIEGAEPNQLTVPGKPADKAGSQSTKPSSQPSNSSTTTTQEQK